MSRPARAALGAALVLGSAFGALVLAPAASAAPLPTPTVSKSTVGWNEYFTVSGSGCLDAGTGAPGDVAISGYEFGDGARATPDGSWSINTVYYGVPSGTYALSASCHLPGGRQAYPAFSVTVTAPGEAPAPPPVAAPAPPPAPRPVPPRTPAPSSAPTTAPRITPTPAPPAAPTTTAAPAPAPAAVAPGPAADCTDCARVTPDQSLEAGERLSLIWTGFRPGESITVVMRSTPVTLGTFTADAAGTVTAAVELPDDAESGAHTLTFSGPLSGDLVVLPFRLAAAESAPAPAATDTNPAAASGPDQAALLYWLVGGGLAAVLLTAGGIALQRSRRSPVDPSSPAPAEPEQLARASAE